MIVKWEKCDKIQILVPNFKSNDIKKVEEVLFLYDYNEFFEKVAKLRIKLKADVEKQGYHILMEFNGVTSLKLEGLGGNYTQIMSLRIEDLTDRGFESSMRYSVEDYEGGVVKFNCINYEVLSFEKIK